MVKEGKEDSASNYSPRGLLCCQYLQTKKTTRLERALSFRSRHGGPAMVPFGHSEV
jgi:hypothetical protein